MLNEYVLLLLALLHGNVQLFDLLFLSLQHSALSMDLSESLSLVLESDLFHSGHFAAQALELARQDAFNQVERLAVILIDLVTSELLQSLKHCG